MNVVAMISNKRDGKELSRNEIEQFIEVFCDERVPDYQTSALLMAIVLKGMTREETAALTEAMLNSGDRLPSRDDRPPSERGGPWVDKHSTGGIGDKTSLLIAPWAVAAGLNVPMISGRGLGPTGGTLDKLESIPGFRTDLNETELLQQVGSIGAAITGATPRLAPADRKLYALRDVTGTVPSVPLITASILSKKLAESPEALILDVKVGSGAFMKTLEQATELAQHMVDVAVALGVPTKAIITDMNQPLGRAVGNANEVNEIIRILDGDTTPTDVIQLSRRLTAELLLLTSSADSLAEAEEKLDQLLSSRAPQQAFVEMVQAQGGDIQNISRLGPSRIFDSSNSGYVVAIDGAALGELIIELGGGRRELTDPVDHSVGINVAVRLGDQVQVDQPICEVNLSNHETPLRSPSWEEISDRLNKAIQIGPEPIEPPDLIIKEVSAN